MKHTTAAVLIIAICAALTAFTIYITQSGWWIIACVITLIACQPANDTNNKPNSNTDDHTTKNHQNKKSDIHLK